MSDYEFTITLRIRHPDIEPARITAVLGADPQATWTKGDPRLSRRAARSRGASGESYWTGRLMPRRQLSSERISSVSAQVADRATRDRLLEGVQLAQEICACLDRPYFARRWES